MAEGAARLLVAGGRRHHQRGPLLVLAAYAELADGFVMVDEMLARSGRALRYLDEAVDLGVAEEDVDELRDAAARLYEAEVAERADTAALEEVDPSSLTPVEAERLADLLEERGDQPALERARALRARSSDPGAHDGRGAPLRTAPADPDWARVLLTLDEELDARGWDQPARLYAVAPTSLDGAPGFEDLEADLRGQLAESGGVPFVELAELGGYPPDQLWGFVAPPWATALVLAGEVWAVTPEDRDARAELAGVPPSRHPLRREARTFTGVTRAGTTLSLAKNRGGAPQVTVGDPAVDGFVPDLLRRALGLPLERFAPACSLPELLARRLLLDLRAEYGWSGPPERADWRSVPEAPAAGRGAEAGAGEHRDGHGAVGSDHLPRILRRLTEVTWRASDDGRLLADDAPVVQAARSAPVVGPSFGQLLAAAARLGHLPLERVVRTRDGAELPGGNAGDVAWAGPILLADRACRAFDDPATSLTALAVEVEPALSDTAWRLLRTIGWTAPVDQPDGNQPDGNQPDDCQPDGDQADGDPVEVAVDDEVASDGVLGAEDQLTRPTRPEIKPWQALALVVVLPVPLQLALVHLSGDQLGSVWVQALLFLLLNSVVIACFARRAWKQQRAA